MVLFVARSLWGFLAARCGAFIYFMLKTIILWLAVSCPQITIEGDILFLVQIPLVLASASAPHFLVCTISCESVVEFLPNLHGYKIGREQRSDLILVTLT